jgi:hypothetical protein
MLASWIRVSWNIYHMVVFVNYQAFCNGNIVLINPGPG